MQSIVISQNGGPEVLELSDVDAPTPGPFDLLVDIAAVGVNYMDIYLRIGQPPYNGALPVVPGNEGAGIVREIGSEVRDFGVGDHVAWASAPGSYAEQVLVDHERAIKVPDGVSLDTAAAVMLQGMTAHFLCSSTYPVQPGDIVVVQPAAGGVGLLLIQLIKLRGGIVIGTTSSEDKARLVKQAGADFVANYENFADVVADATGGVGVAAVFDGIGASTFEASLAALRTRGYFVLFGAASGPVEAFNPQRLGNSGSLYLTRPLLWHYIATREELIERVNDLFGAIADGRLSVRIGGTYPLERADLAHDDLGSRKTAGKLLLLPRTSPLAASVSRT